MDSCDISNDLLHGCLENLRSLVEERDRSDGAFTLNGRAGSVAEFLSVCVRSLSAEAESRRDPYFDEVYWARDIFIRGGLDALAAGPWHSTNRWVQIGIRFPTDSVPASELYRQIASLTRGWVSDATIDNFFFMNKPPGMRLRFQPMRPGGSAEFAEALHAEVMRWRAEGLISHVESGVYEPESQLFGGSRSMNFVHALFTVDSLFWLDYHARRAADGDESTPAWLVSLAMLQAVFAGLDITGWEDIGVWDRIRDVTGRRLSEDKVLLPMYAEVAEEIRAVWSQRDQIAGKLSPPIQALVARYLSAIHAGAAQWRSGYFCQPGASLGPRAAAAFYVIFHWNRAALSRAQQALLAESLAERMVDDDR